MDSRSTPGFNINININTLIRSITMNKDNNETMKLMKGVEEDILLHYCV